MFLELCCASDSELAAAVVEHSVAIRVNSSENLQLASTRCALHRVLRICKAYDVVVDISVSIPCTVGTHFRWINDTFNLVVAAIGLCRHAVRIGGGFCWEWTNDNEFWDLVIVRNFFAKCDTSSFLVSTAAVGQQFVDSEEVFYNKMKSDSYRYLAEFATGETKSKTGEDACDACVVATEIAEKDLVVTNPVRLAMGLSSGAETNPHGPDRSKDRRDSTPAVYRQGG